MPLISYLTTRRSPVQSQILRPNFRSLAALALTLAAAAIMVLVLLTTHLYNAPVTSRPEQPVVSAAPAGDANPDSNLPICKRHGGPTC
jgi:hypothetical protein